MAQEMNQILTDEELEAIENQERSQNDWLWSYTRAIEAAVLKKLNSAEPACFVQVTPDGNPVWSEITKTKEGARLNQYDRQMGWRVIPVFTHPPAPSAVEWAEAYAAFKGAFDTPQMRRQISDEYSHDARKRLREFNEAMLAAARSK